MICLYIINSTISPAAVVNLKKLDVIEAHLPI